MAAAAQAPRSARRSAAVCQAALALGLVRLMGLLGTCGSAAGATQAHEPRAAAPWAAMPATLLPTRLPVEDDGSAGPGWKVRATAADFEAADATPVRALSGEWSRYTPRAGRNAALQSVRVELAAVHQRWELSAVARSEAVVTGSRGAWDVVYAYKQRQTPAEGSAYSVQADETGVVWAGLRAARSWVLPPGGEYGLQLTGAVSLLSVRKLQTQDATGQVDYRAATGYGFDALTLQHDTRRQFGGYGHRNATGSGYTIDLGLLWQPSADSFVNLAAADLASRLRVQAVSTQQTSVSSSTAALDPQGYVEYRPLLTGRYTAADLDVALSRKWSAIVGTRLSGWGGGDMTAGARWERIAGIDLPALWAVLPLAPGWRLQLDGETRFRSLGVGLIAGHGALMLRTSSLPVGRARAVGGTATFNFPLRQ
jgi:hypothetical protein